MSMPRKVTWKSISSGWLANNVESDSRVFIYYSGHGAPDPRTGDAYLVPYDGDPSFIENTGYSLKKLYDTLGKLPSKEIVVILDSCFSGAGGRRSCCQRGETARNDDQHDDSSFKDHALHRRLIRSDQHGI